MSNSLRSLTFFLGLDDSHEPVMLRFPYLANLHNAPQVLRLLNLDTQRLPPFNRDWRDARVTPSKWTVSEEEEVDRREPRLKPSRTEAR